MSRRADEGTVTAELAICLPGVMVLCAALLLAGQAVIGEVRCTDAARAAARLAARGEPAGAVIAEAGRRAPPGAQVHLSRTSGSVTVGVEAPLRGPGASWIGLVARGSASASVEDDP
jgi:Flp pilus assembly protein TadG